MHALHLKPWSVMIAQIIQVHSFENTMWSQLGKGNLEQRMNPEVVLREQG